MNNDPERERSTIPKLWAAFTKIVRADWATFSRPISETERPTAPSRKRNPVIDQHSEDDRPNENWYWKSEIFWGWAILGVSVVMTVGWFISANQYSSVAHRKYSHDFQRFKSDFAPGVTANEVERIADMLEDFDQGSALMRCCAVSLLWLIFLALLRINATIETQTKRLLSSAEREKPPPPK